MTDFRPRFLTVENVLRLHEQSIANWGGDAGLRDRGLLESAIAQPQAGFGGEYLHPTIPEMASAYLFHLAKNHPFVDGNKRVAALAAMAFLRVNNITIEVDELEFEQVVLSVARGEMKKPAIAAFFAEQIRPRED